MGNEVSNSDEDLSSDIKKATFKENIGVELFEKVQSLHEENADEVTGMLLEMPEKDLEILLKDESLLKRRIDEAVEILKLTSGSKDTQRINKKEDFGDIIYPHVEAIYSEEDTAEKITGMLLEMDMKEIKKLVENKQALLDKIHEAANVLGRGKNTEQNHRATTKRTPSTSVELGEKIYETISRWYPDEEEAAKLTGMVLEMNEDEIMIVAQDEELLKHRVDEAKQALKMQT